LKTSDTYFISFENTKLPKSIIKKKIAGLEIVFDKLKIDKEEHILIEDINFDAYRYRFIDNIAAFIAEKYYHENKIKFKNEYLETNIGHDYIERLIKKEILTKSTRIIRDLFLANIALKKNGLKEIFIYNEKLDFEFLYFVKKYLNFKKNIKFSSLNYYTNKIKKFLFKIYNFIKILFFFEKLLIKSLNNFKNIQKKYIASIRIDEGLPFSSYPYSPAIFLNSKNIDNDDVIFYCEKKIENLTDENRKKYHILTSFDDLFKKISFKSYIKNIYIKNFILRIQMMKFFFRFNIFCSIIYNSFETIIFWNIFYNIYKVKHNIILTADPGVTSYYMHKKNDVETSFVYPNFTEQLSSFLFKELPTSNDWSYIKFDNIYCDKTSKVYFDTLINYKNFFEIGFLFKNYILSKDKQIIKKNIDFHFESKIIFFYDGSIGAKGIMTINEYRLFLESIDFVLKNTDFCVGLGIKNPQLVNQNKGIENLIINLKKYKRFKLLNELNINRYSLLNVPDLIISCPVSTILFEALSLDKKLLIYNPLKRYTKLPNLLFNDREIIKSNNKKELLREIDNLLNKSEHKYTSETYFMSAEKGIKNFDKIFN
jgi:hypothetical protein